MDNSQSLPAQELAYDLRQTYARIVGQHLIDITVARKNKKYADYFNALEDLYTITQHKFKKLKSDGESYNDLKKAFLELINKYSGAYLGNSSDPDEVYKIECALRKLERWLYNQIDKAKMFGSRMDMEGLI